MKVLITGSNGFIGSYFKNKYSNVFNISCFSFLNDNLEELNMSNIDIVIHLSALVHQMGGASEMEYDNINVVQTVLLAKKAKLNGVKHFIFMSTVKVYGEESEVSYTENSICKPVDDYGKSKLKAESCLQELEENTFKVSIIRTPIVYGYGVKANIRNLVSLIDKTSFLPFLNINNKRSMVYIGNLCHLVISIIERKAEGVFLASDNVAISTTSLVELIAQGIDKKIYLFKLPFFESVLKLLKPSFHKRLYESLEVDNTNTRKKLNLTNPFSVEDGIKFMLKGEK